jgi:hypothetical protein
MVIVQVHRRSVHAAIETVQDETSSGEGAFETPGAGTAGGWCRGCSDQWLAGGAYAESLYEAVVRGLKQLSG